MKKKKFFSEKIVRVKMYKSYFLFLLIIGFTFSGCLVGPKYERPTEPDFTHYEGQDTTQDTIPLVSWTEIYNDRELFNLINTVLDSNLDLMTAIGRVEEARAVYGFSKDVRWPSIGYNVGASTQEVRQNSGAAGLGIDGPVYHGFATMNWEIDLFGRLRHQKRSSWAQFLAEESNAQAVRVSLIAETATLYFLLRDLDQRLEIAQNTVTTRTESFDVISKRFDAGYVSELDKLQAQQQLSTVEALIPNLERQIVATQNALRVLSGQPPGPITRGKTNYEQGLPDSIPPGIPSDLLQRRPDIIAAEQNLISQTEQIGVAASLRWPTISLTGFLGMASPQLSTILDPESFAAGIGGGLFGPIFEFGKNKRRVEVQRAQADQFSYQYKKVVLNAFAEVDNALTELRTSKKEHEAYATQVMAANKAYTLTLARYDNGYSDYLELLNQQNILFDAQLNESITQSQQNIAIVNLFKALGGGWDTK
jgi:multidrug efflux system outer membrane protein